MSMPRVVALILLLAAGFAGGALALQRQRGAVLREQIALLRSDQRELGTLHAENEKLKASLPTDAEFARLRSDYGASMRLRTELDALRRQISAAEAAASPSRH